MNANFRLAAPPLTRRTAIGAYPIVASYDMLGKQLHNSNPVKLGKVGLIRDLLRSHFEAIIVTLKSYQPIDDQ